MAKKQQQPKAVRVNRPEAANQVVAELKQILQTRFFATCLAATSCCFLAPEV